MTKRHRLIAWILLAVGGLISVLCLALMGYARTSAVDTAFDWDGETLYVTSTVRGGVHRCTVTPAAGESMQFEVPAMPNRGPHIAGARVDAWFDGSSSVTCTSPVLRTTGAAVRLYPLVEQPWLAASGVLIVLLGLARLGLFKPTSRYP